MCIFELINNIMSVTADIHVISNEIGFQHFKIIANMNGCVCSIYCFGMYTLF